MSKDTGSSDSVTNLCNMLKKWFGGLLGGGSKAEAPVSIKQRRKLSRRKCEFDVEAAIGRSQFHATVVDMGVGGLRLRCSTQVKVKNKGVLKITYPEKIRDRDVLTIEGLVRWDRTRESDGAQFIGVEFKDPKSLGPTWVKARMEDLGFRPYNLREQRKHQRVPAKIPGTIQLNQDQVHCTIKNVGMGGLYIMLLKPIRAGVTVDLEISENPHLPTGTYPVTIRHQQHPDPSDPFGYGVTFAHLSSEQQRAVEKYVIDQQQLQFEAREDFTESAWDLAIRSHNAAANEDIVIPDLASILAETEPEEEDEEAEPEEEVEEI